MIYKKSALAHVDISCKNCTWQGRFEELAIERVPVEVWGERSIEEREKNIEFYSCPECARSVGHEQRDNKVLLSLIRLTIVESPALVAQLAAE